jgi:hypothetical protein
MLENDDQDDDGDNHDHCENQRVLKHLLAPFRKYRYSVVLFDWPHPLSEVTISNCQA